MRRIKPELVLFLTALALRSASLLLAASVLHLKLSDVVSFQDGPAYITLASSWPIYPYEQTAAHFPLYGLAIRLFALLIPVEPAALAVSLLAGSLAVAVYAQVLRRYTERWFEIALVFCIFPFRWFNVSQLAMSESLFMLLLLLSLLLHSKGRRLYSGVALGFSLLTRLSGVLVLPALLYRSFRTRERASALLWLLPAGLCLALLGLYFEYRFADPLIYFKENNELWGGGRFSYPFSAYVSGFLDPAIYWMRKPYVAFVLIEYFGGLILGIVRWRRGQPELAFWILWAAPFLLLQTVLHGQGTNWGFISSGRLMIPSAPAILLFWLNGLSRRILYIVFALMIPLAFLFTIAEFSLQTGP